LSPMIIDSGTRIGKYLISFRDCFISINVIEEGNRGGL
jgi:hypothetical protein